MKVCLTFKVRMLTLLFSVFMVIFMTKSQAIEYFCGVGELARVIGTTKQAIYQWEMVPPEQQLRLHVLTNGELKADRLVINPNSKVA